MTYFIERVHTHSQEGGFDHRLAIVWEFDRNAQAFKTQEFKYWVVGYAIGFKRMNHHLMLILEISASSQKVCWISRLRLHRVRERLAGCADVAQNKSKPIRPSQTMCCPAATKRSSSIILSSPPIPFETELSWTCPLRCQKETDDETDEICLGRCVKWKEIGLERLLVALKWGKFGLQNCRESIC